MATMAAQIDTYREIGELSAKMVEAAQAQDWDLLVELEKSVTAMRNALIAEGDNNASLTEAERNLKAALIQRILDDDAEIRRHTEPWMDHVRQFLISDNQRRRIENAYGLGGGGAFGG